MVTMLRDRRVGLLLVASAGFVSLLGAAPQSLQPAVPTATQSPLNPLVLRKQQPPPGPTPAECEQGLTSAPAPRINVTEIPLPEPPAIEAAAPPSSALRSALHEAQDALADNDRPAFDENRTRARALLAVYPPGEERRVAEEVSRLHEIAARLWDAQYESPFFGTESTEYTLVSRLPGYEEAIRRSTLTDDDQRRFYPAAESRQFVTRAAADRLQRLGIRGAAPAPRIARAEPWTVAGGAGVHPAPAREPRPRVTQTARSTRSSTSFTPRRTTPARSTPRRTTATRSTPSRTTATASRSTSSASAAPPRPTSTTNPSKPAPVTPVPSSPNPSVPPTTAAVPAPAAPAATTPPAAGGLPTPEPTATVADTAFDTPPTTTTTSAPITTPDTALATTDTTDTTPITPPPATRGRSVILPVILILIGLGVLIVLFRASK
jgi:hypothetical protein